MKRKTEFKSTEKVAGIKLQRNNYEVIVHYYENTKEVNYIQVIKNRKKISNFQSLELAERRMLAEAMLDLNQTKICFDENNNEITEISKSVGGWTARYQIPDGRGFIKRITNEEKEKYCKNLEKINENHYIQRTIKR